MASNVSDNSKNYSCEDCGAKHDNHRQLWWHRKNRPKSCDRFEQKGNTAVRKRDSRNSENVQTVDFPSVTEFTAWKSAREDDAAVDFVKRCGDQKKPNGAIYSYFWCSRGGVPKESSVDYDRGRRVEKAKGSVRSFNSFVRQKMRLVTEHQKQTHKRHRKAYSDYIDSEHLPRKCVEVKEGSEWLVSSATDSSRTYSVTAKHQLCNCRLKCVQCGVCTHAVVCSCADAKFTQFNCKHAHVVAILYEFKEIGSQELTEASPSTTTVSTPLTTTYNRSRSPLNRSTPPPPPPEKNKTRMAACLEKLDRMRSAVEQKRDQGTDDMWRAFQNILDNADRLLTAMKPEQAVRSIDYPPSTSSSRTFQKQVRVSFPPKKSNTVDAKKKKVERRQQISELNSIYLQNCSSCNKLQDEDCDAWVVCDICSKAFHYTCASSALYDHTSMKCTDCVYVE